jgi:hypothetical protein
MIDVQFAVVRTEGMATMETKDAQGTIDGLYADNLVEVLAVTIVNEVITASAKLHHAELFCGILFVKCIRNPLQMSLNLIFIPSLMVAGSNERNLAALIAEVKDTDGQLAYQCAPILADSIYAHAM